MPNFCGKTIIIHYNGNIIHVMAKQPVKVIFNGEPVSLPYNAEGAEIFGNIYFAYVKIPSIRSSILTTKYMFFIKVSEKFFQSNTQGQCGSPKNKHDECKRKNGKVEPTNCCSETAFEWKVDDPNKQHCSTIPKVVPCKEKPTKPPCKYSTTVCDAILGDSFSICRSNIDLSNYIKACAYDNCETNETHCCSLEAAALKCKENGFCVDWRQSTNGLCKMTCSSNFIYKPCAIKNHNYCKNNKIITGETFDEATEGCFCPSGMMLSEDRTKCVNSCLTCRDNSGNKRQNGEEWHHPNNTCISYQCLEGNLIKTEIVCSSYPICKETEKIWDEYHCCYKCPVKEDNCKLQAKPLKIIKDNCTATVEVHSCEGTCSSYSIFDYTKDKMMHNCNCCQEFTTETKEVTLNCKNSLTMQYSYISALECKCTRCLNSAK
ncbi:intestinal mucin-like protein [Narcine bancroftii]|uniref:intestinal mucin-like protein n=1 Tax=Narcine bancroftii TaxID=1343680 RepID=UPI0038315E25